MADSATVTAAQIARLAGVGRAAVSNWRKRYDDFPQPVGGTATSPTFALTEIESWLRGQGKLAEVDAEDRLWHELDASRHADESLADALVRVGLFLQFLDERPDRWRSLAPRNDARVCTALAGELDKRAATLPSPATSPLTVAQIPSLRLAAAVATEAAEARTGATVFVDLLDRYREETGRQLAATPTQLADLMALLSPHGVTLDPACGLGTLLHAVRRHGETTVIGQDSDATLANLAAIRLRSMGRPAAIHVGNSFDPPTGSDPSSAVSAEGVDAVLCDPPFNERSWDPEEHAYDARFDYGLPPRSEPELAWVQLCLSRVRPGGTVLVLLPAGAGSRPTGRRVRAELIRRGALREVVGLPAGHLSYKPAPTQLWLLRRPADDAPSPRQVLLVDVPPDREPGAVAEVVLDAHHRFAKDPASVDTPGVARSVPAIQLLGDAVDVTPARWVAAPEPELNVADLEELFGNLTELVNAAQVSGYRFVPGSGAPQTVTVGDLSSRGAIEIIIAPLRATPAGGDEPMLMAADVTAGRDASGTATAEDGAPRTKAGDIVLPMLAETLSPRVMDQGGALLGPQLVLLRLDQNALDPWFVAGFLTTPSNARLASSQSSVHRVDVKQARLPRLPIEAQRRYGAYFRRLSHLHQTLTSAAALADELVKQSAAALTAGVIDLP